MPVRRVRVASAEAGNQASWHARAGRGDEGAWQDISAQCDALPDALQRDARAMLDDIRRLRHYRGQKTSDRSSGCVIF
ncbi:hypothetical protein [Noviherbaspirillum pedocola]|uniref:Uncharacterized protein n=1 Tax=Noviherbaspirillum pedocola TaxID=2801341 RepID=A0A934T0Q4_9BURK|nr:hypothetical protein [Noviherbaspirillum pedocola]MBK4738875.1 hypothetical protein [Noviherbaspirillum pedocola]